MKATRLLFVGHLLALAFGLGGLLIALPHPELWAGSRFAEEVFDFGMQYGGSLHIIFGALTMLAFGGYWIGWRRTLIFFAVTVILSLSSELIGTGTGWPFGNYAYTSFLGYKVLDRVPFTIPLSWFYVGFASYLLANILAGSRAPRRQAVLAVLGGAYLLTVWDLVLDPAMAHESLAVRFWTWSQTGPYFGMPLKNFAGWTLTAVIFMAISRLLWRRDLGAREYPGWLPFGVYLANMIFAMALSLSVGLWEPAVLAVALGIVPAALAWRSQPPAEDQVFHRPHPTRRISPAPSNAVAQRAIAVGAKTIAARQVELHVEGVDHLPRTGPVLIAARHYHHLHDGCALIGAVGRPLHILVALDWVRSRVGRSIMERACRMAGWPVVLRGDRLAGQDGPSAFRRDEARRYVHRAVRESVDLLRSGEALLVFPEAYPNVDPVFTPKRDDEFLPFQPGFIRLVELAQRDGMTRVPIVPAGFAYAPSSRWQVSLRFGAPVYLDDRTDSNQIIRYVEDQVRVLSGPGYSVSTAIPQKAMSS